MSFLDFFRKRNEVLLNPRVLVGSVGPGFESFILEDEGAYRRYFDDTCTKIFEDVDSLMAELSKGYEIVHLFAKVTEHGVGSSTMTGTELIQKSVAFGTKLFWIASSNDGNSYIKQFKLKGTGLNLVMTINRRGDKFPAFLRDLLGEMKSGASMPIAWNRIAPQIPNREHPDAPESIFFCGLGQVRFI